MTGSRISYLWNNERAAKGFASGVSLHSHTNRSKETLDFIVKLAHEYRCFSGIMAREEKRCRQKPSPADRLRRELLDAAAHTPAGIRSGKPPDRGVAPGAAAGLDYRSR